MSEENKYRFTAREEFPKLMMPVNPAGEPVKVWPSEEQHMYEARGSHYVNAARNEDTIRGW